MVGLSQAEEEQASMILVKQIYGKYFNIILAANAKPVFTLVKVTNQARDVTWKRKPPKNSPHRTC